MVKLYKLSNKIHMHIVGRHFKIHNGKRFILIKVFSNMVGYRFRDFVRTKLIQVQVKHN